MKFLVARLNHETNTFSPVRTPLAAFEPRHDAEALADQREARTAMGAFIRLIEAHPGSTLITPLSATANPSGTVTADAYAALANGIIEAATPDVDAILLDLHGAMVAEHVPDGEGELLRRLRARLPQVPIAVALDLHGNVTQAMVEHADLIVGFKTYPHIDMAETGEHAGRLLMDWLAGTTRPVMRWRQLPLLSHTLRSNTHEGAMRRAVEAARAMEALPGVLAVTVMAGFSLADIEDAGMSVIVVTDNDAALADRLAGDLAAQIWREREGFVWRSEPLADSLRRAQTLAAQPGHGPVLLLDHSDNVMSGGSCDTMDVLAAALEAGLTGIAAGPFCDPQAVAQLWAVPDGAHVEVDLGNRFPLHAQDVRQPLLVAGTVLAHSDGRFTVSGPIYTGTQADMGRTVLLDIGAAQLVITEKRMEPYDIGVFHCVGLEPSAQRFLLLKSRMYCRPVFGPLSRGLVECDADKGGPTSSNYAFFDFRQLRRPLYPLDDIGL
jgi:microcystin degradation protein MlrC